jgi:outer membrane protein TolC
VRASEGQLRVARGARLPALSLNSSYAKIDFPEDVFSFDRFLTDWSVNVQLTVPIFTGGRLHADVLAAEAARDQAGFRLKQARQQAQLEAGDARNQLESASAAWSASLGTAAQAQRAFEIGELRYRNGLSTLTELNDTRLQLAQAQANTAQAARDLQVARMRMTLLRDLPFSSAGSGTMVTVPAATPASLAPAGAGSATTPPGTPRPAGSISPTGGS